ncbi:MAG: ROK family protein [Pyrinomonadaceae bacterium]|nr:ROK family protein [Pyrinomonadaceae bacterium]
MSDISSTPDKLIGLEISSSAVNAVKLGSTGEIVDAVERPLDHAGGTSAALEEFINELKTRFGAFETLGVAVPGLLNRKTRRVEFSMQNPEHEREGFFGELEAATGVRLVIENDANSAAFGEYMLGAGRSSRSMFYGTFGSGVGGALIFDGAIWHGASGFAGEFGHILINSEGQNLEGVASAGSIVKRTKSRFHQDDTSSLSRIGESNITLRDIVSAAIDEDDFAIMMLERTGSYIGTAVAGVINLLNIETVVIGGEISRAGDVVLNAIRERAMELSFAPSFASTKILAGKLGTNAGAIGAALLSRESSSNKP